MKKKKRDAILLNQAAAPQRASGAIVALRYLEAVYHSRLIARLVIDPSGASAEMGDGDRCCYELLESSDPDLLRWLLAAINLAFQWGDAESPRDGRWRDLQREYGGQLRTRIPDDRRDRTDRAVRDLGRALEYGPNEHIQSAIDELLEAAEGIRLIAPIEGEK